MSNNQDQMEAIKQSGQFDAAYYLSRYPDIAAAGIDPVEHYCRHGWAEHRNPSPHFNTRDYLLRNEDVRNSGMNPFYHYLIHGMREGRKPSGPGFVPSVYQKRQDGNRRMPLVSVVVPNYNHARYLRKRLDSIYQQTYRRFEVILLDDCSQDGSRDILREYKQRYPTNTRLAFNDRKSPGVFHQWSKGLALANGELVWIAESDDWCTSDFLEELTSCFQDEAVMLAYCRTVFADESGNRQLWTLQEYLSDISRDLWNQPFTLTAHTLVKQAWSIKNIIPNVSGALFRNPRDDTFLQEREWKSMRICGDWAFYLRLVRGGLVAYATQPTNYYCIHDRNFSIEIQKQDVYYREYEAIAKIVRADYAVPDSVLNRQANLLVNHWKSIKGDFSESRFARLFSIPRIQNETKRRKPNLLMVGYAFSAGGGETFPIFLANALKQEGYTVTYLCLDEEKREPGVRHMLRNDVPVVNDASKLQRIVTDFGIDIIHTHHGWSDRAILERLPPGFPCSYVASLHGMHNTVARKEIAPLLHRLAARADKLVYTADKNLEPFRELSLYRTDQFVKIGNFVPPLNVVPADRSRLGIPADAFVLCHVSRALPYKGWEEAIESVKEARRLSGQNIHLLLVGDGPEHHRLKGEAPPYIHFLGFRSDIQNLYAASDLGYLPSRFTGESFPLVLITCLQSGKPVLASDTGEIRQMLTVRSGMAGTVFALQNGRIPIPQVARLIASFASDPAYYAARSKHVRAAAEKFRVDQVVRQYELLYHELVERRRESR